MQDRDLATVLRQVADLYGGPARETILFENFDKHLTELRLILDVLQPDAALLDLGGGGVLILGAPNAASLMKHVKLLLGRHPYSPFEDWIGDQYFAHIREYTAAEYQALVTLSGLTAERTVRSAAIPRTRARNRYHRRKHGFFSPVAWALRLAYLMEQTVPPWRHNIYVVARKPSPETNAAL